MGGIILFNIKTYLGYTATPFANVLQDRNETPDSKYIEKYKFKGETIEKELALEGNIFPDDFIELLQPPSNYVGAKQIFETIYPIENSTDDNEKIPLVSPPVDDYIDNFPTRVYENPEGKIVGIENYTEEEWDEKHKNSGYLEFDTYKDYKKGTRASVKDDKFPKELPVSLKEAVKCFILSLAIRESRIPHMEKSDLFQPHNTMLVHISRFTLWQNTTKDLLEKYVNNIISKINTDLPSNPDSIYSELEKTWYRYYAHIVEKINSYLPKGYVDEFMIPVVYDSIRKLLPEAIKGIEVKAINSITNEKLVYPKNSKKKYIAVGGNRLSRGFTLEGLTINYFIRTTNYSDALLQMGRWFGYRPGYLDCCKIFTTQDSLNKFNSTTKCIEELEIEFKKMEAQDKDPRSFELRVRTHPGTLEITRPSILKNAKVVKWSYEDQLEMTTRFNVSKNHIENTWNNFKSKIAPHFIKSKKEDLLAFSTDGNGIIDILKNQSNNFDSDRINQMSMFIELCNKRGLLNEWTVALKITGSAQNMNPELLNIKSGLVQKIELAKRSGPGLNSNDENSFLNQGIFKATSKSANIMSSPKDMAVLLSPAEIKAADESFYSNKAKELLEKGKAVNDEEARKLANEYKTIPERYYRERLNENQGLLVIYLFDSKYAFNQEGNNSKIEILKNKFKNYIDRENIDTTTPLVGFAIGFPPMKNAPGGIYMQGDYDLDLESEDEEEIGDDEEILSDLNEI